MKVSCESVLKELAGAMAVKCHVAYSSHAEKKGLFFLPLLIFARVT